MSQRVNATTLRQRMQAKENLQLIDVRSPGEYATGHVPCAANIPLEQLQTRLPDLNISSQIVLICKSGQRATTAASWLCNHSDVLVLEGGTNGWLEAGFPVVQTGSSRWSLERQVGFGAGLIVLVATFLTLLVDPDWVFLAMFIGAGLTFAGLTGICPMGMALARLPWNRPNVQGIAPPATTSGSQVETRVQQ